ncbi:alpha-L-rhamnosidase [Tangfeifania diversioriginum]|uniref:Alpha-L-rhamnosidase n=2 Tax=Tangfeifania diversioriginum TaxID=1168035 RepID=A0A1M6CK69_9BACT|nr:alpha-L-rhamnosidase [Tangfeifania diversioriginum]
MKMNRLFFLLSFFILISCSSDKQQLTWPEATAESKPWTRWWWMGNAVDKENISRELDEMAEMGIGGVEITPIYGVRGEEDRFIEYLSPEFSDMLQFTIEKAHSLNMGVDLPPGSGWRCGGPFVPEEKGLWSLRVHKQQIRKGKTAEKPDVPVIAIASFVDENNEATAFNPDENFTAPANGTVYFAERLKNRDMVKRASDGGKGWAIDTFNEEITDWYLNEIWERLEIDKGLIRCFFHDSFEYTGDFTTHFTEEFKTRRGYDLAEYLHVLAGDSEEEEIIARVKSDYRETLSDLVLESFIDPMTEWANSHQSLNRNQAHGSPGNILDLYAACDIPETEIFRTVEPGTVDVFVNKFASSAAHVTGQKLVSSESYTWLDEHWTVTTSDMMRATNRFFLAGINHMFFHGTCYSPDDAEWPGWLFYASTQVNNRNPLWREMPALFKYIERSQTVLQKSTAKNDVLVYWPYYDVAAGKGRLFNHLGVNKDAGWFITHPINELSESLMEAGYTFDYISDKQLLNCEMIDDEIVTGGDANYKAVVVPKTKYIPLETMQQLRQFVDEGGTVYFDEFLPESVPGMFNLEERERQLKTVKTDLSEHAGNVVDLLSNAGISGEQSLAEKGFHFLKMKNENEDWYMVFNCNSTALDEWVDLQSTAQEYLFYFPENGEISTAESNNNSVRIQLEPERTVFIRCLNKKVYAPAFTYFEPEQNSREIEGMWKISFLEGGPVYPGDVATDQLVSWTEIGDEQTQRFAGTARYSIEFNWNENQSSAFLNLGKVKDCARVKLNGELAGALLGPSYKVKVDNLQQGKNLLEVEVTNVAANRIRDLDIRGVDWKKFHDINFVNIEYEPFDASGWEIKDAGLLGPVTLTGIDE